MPRMTMEQHNTEWQPVRVREKYRKLRNAVGDVLDTYWIIAAKPNAVDDEIASVCDKIVLASFRLLKYIRKETPGLSHYIDEEKIGDMDDAAVNFYCLGEGSTTSYQEESDVLEILSRAAYRKMKVKPSKDDEMLRGAGW